MIASMPEDDGLVVTTSGTMVYEGTPAIAHGEGHASLEEHAIVSGTMVYEGPPALAHAPVEEHATVMSGTAVYEGPSAIAHGGSIDRPAAPRCDR